MKEEQTDSTKKTEDDIRKRSRRKRVPQISQSEAFARRHSSTDESQSSKSKRQASDKSSNVSPVKRTKSRQRSFNATERSDHSETGRENRPERPITVVDMTQSEETVLEPLTIYFNG